MHVRNSSRLRPIWVTLVLVAAVLLLCGPLLFHDPLPRGSDVFAACHYAQAFAKAFAEGDLYPRWTDLSNQNLGAPMFVFYPPLAYYAVGAALWITGSIVGAFKLYLTVLAALTFLAFYALAREWIAPGLPAAFAAALYLLLPYHALDMYQRFAVAETTALMFTPLVLLFARRSFNRAGGLDFALLGLSYAGLIYTHVITAFMFSLFFGIWLLWEARGRWSTLLRPVLAILCGLGLAAPVLLPAIAEREHVNVSWAREMPNGDFRINFIFNDDLLPGLNIKDPVKPPVLKAAHSQLLLALVAVALTLAWSARGDGRRRRDVLAIGSGCALAYLMQLELSTPIWRTVPELPTIQFPWRFQTLMVLTAALLAGFALASCASRKGRRTGFVVFGALLFVATVVINLALAHQNAFLKPFNFDEQQTKQVSVVQWIQPALTPVEFKAYRQFNRTRIDMPRTSFVAGRGTSTVAKWVSSRRELDVDTPTGGTVRLRSFWFPGWTATLDGAALALDSSFDGTIKFSVPPGSHRVELVFEPTLVRRAATWTAWTALLLLALLPLSPMPGMGRPARPTQDLRPGRLRT